MGLIPPAHNYRFVEMGTSKELKNEALTNRGSFKNGRLNPEIADFFRDSDLYIYIYIYILFLSLFHVYMKMEPNIFGPMLSQTDIHDFWQVMAVKICYNSFNHPSLLQC